MARGLVSKTRKKIRSKLNSPKPKPRTVLTVSIGASGWRILRWGNTVELHESLRQKHGQSARSANPLHARVGRRNCLETAMSKKKARSIALCNGFLNMDVAHFNDISYHRTFILVRELSINFALLITSSCPRFIRSPQ